MVPGHPQHPGDRPGEHEAVRVVRPRPPVGHAVDRSARRHGAALLAGRLGDDLVRAAPFPKPWAYRLICAASGTTLGHTGLPRLGGSFTVDLSGARRNAKGLFVLGVSNRKWGGLTLPVSLGAVGAQGCSLLVSGEFVFPISTDTAGRHSFRLTVPNLPVLRGFRFYNQFVVADPNANTYGATFSNGGAATIG